MPDKQYTTTECTLTITKLSSGWSAEASYLTGDKLVSSGNRILAMALWDIISRCMNYPDNPCLVAITVKGKPMTPQEAYRIIEKDLRGSALDYALPGYRKFLQIEGA